MPDIPAEVYRTLARAQLTRWGYHETLDPDDFAKCADVRAADPNNLRADVAIVWDMAVAAGRRQAAEAIRAARRASGQNYAWLYPDEAARIAEGGTDD